VALADVAFPPVEPGDATSDRPPPTNLGRDKLAEWGRPVWDRIDHAVTTELDRSCVALKVLPAVRSSSPSTRTVPRDLITADAAKPLRIDQDQSLPLLEQSQSFELTREQYLDEERIGTAATLAARAANRLAQGIDKEVFVGNTNPNLDTAATKNKVVDVPRREAKKAGAWGQNTFAAVTAGCAALQSAGHYGPYALVLSTAPFGDVHAPPTPNAPSTPVDRIRPLLLAGLHMSGTLPADHGLLVSVGGSTVDLVISVHGMTAFVQVGPDNTYLFRVYERFTVRVKEQTALVQLQFA
jgi:uncharacterized linocin/CFP29 family protein